MKFWNLAWFSVDIASRLMGRNHVPAYPATGTICCVVALHVSGQRYDHRPFSHGSRFIICWLGSCSQQSTSPVVMNTLDVPVCRIPASDCQATHSQCSQASFEQFHSTGRDRVLEQVGLVSAVILLKNLMNCGGENYRGG